MRFFRHFFLRLLFVCFALNTSSHIATAQDVKAGVMLPLSGAGTYDFIGEEIRRGIVLALKDNPDVQIEFLYEDFGLVDKTKAASAANKLANLDKVDIAFDAFVTTLAASGPIFNRVGIPAVTIWDDSREVQGSKANLFGFGYTTEIAGEDLAEFARRERHIDEIAILSTNDEWSEVISTSFENRFKALGGKVVFRERANPDDNLRSLATRLKHKKVQAVYAPMWGNAFISFFKALREIGFQPERFVGDALLEPDLLALGDAVEGIFLTQIFLEDAALAELYEREFHEPPTPNRLAMAGLGYDIVVLIKALTEKIKAQGEKITRQSISKALEGLEVHGRSGSIKFHPDHSVYRHEKILQVRKGKFALVK